MTRARSLLLSINVYSQTHTWGCPGGTVRLDNFAHLAAATIHLLCAAVLRCGSTCAFNGGGILSVCFHQHSFQVLPSKYCLLVADRRHDGGLVVRPECGLCSQTACIHAVCVHVRFIHMLWVTYTYTAVCVLSIYSYTMGATWTSTVHHSSEALEHCCSESDRWWFLF